MGDGGVVVRRHAGFSAPLVARLGRIRRHPAAHAALLSRPPARFEETYGGLTQATAPQEDELRRAGTAVQLLAVTPRPANSVFFETVVSTPSHVLKKIGTSI